MQVREFYKDLGEDFEEVFERIGNEQWIEKYLKKFATEAYHKKLDEAIAEQSWSEAFKMAHSIKGLAMNLGLSRLAKLSSELCEPMRAGAPTIDIAPLHEVVDAEYDRVTEAMSKYI